MSPGGQHAPTPKGDLKACKDCGGPWSAAGLRHRDNCPGLARVLRKRAHGSGFFPLGGRST